MKGKAVVGQSGGPTSVINSSLAGVISKALEEEAITKILGMNFGIEGFMNEDFFDLSAQSPEVIKGLRGTPSSALGSSRHKLVEDDFPVILEILKKYNIRYFFLIGGNDTMDTVHRVELYCREQNYELRGIGIPKTVDNDLFGTDYTPGFPSAARSNILNVLQAGVLARDMKKVDQFVIYQTIGRDAGWLAAATALARKKEGDAPHLIYCPERPLAPEQMIEDAKECIRKYGWVSIVVSEGLLYKDGTPVSASQNKDKFNNTEFGAMGGASVALNVHRILTDALEGARGEFQITESLIMSAFDRSEPQDLDMAYKCGQEAVRLACGGTSAVMVTIKRNPDCSFSLGQAALEDVAVKARAMPREYINERGNDVSDEFLNYMTPLISSLPQFVALENKFYKE
ncbi:diphosphate--fructose-6-phosphate 1-phosphotransferase [Oceanispirochaeta crateris]|uniref:Pyrophosphate--fructose 6-phosphate 1-phosphotransferase n=1 Tax=Oceanispirochaeta crateris TaxID=2518645 RepID=A0A5C1QTI8_9SPIO|nr:diphosphate--fructose-6-phosphate 1-phosphotransferase [Oceanispirochaeta crateris]